jgi:hypothetical protein
MLDSDTRLRQSEALTLLTNRILMDFISLQVDAGKMSVEGAQSLMDFSATEVLRGSPGLEPEVEFFLGVLKRRFDETDYSKD